MRFIIILFLSSLFQAAAAEVPEDFRRAIVDSVLSEWEDMPFYPTESAAKRFSGTSLLEPFDKFFSDTGFFFLEENYEDEALRDLIENSKIGDTFLTFFESYRLSQDFKTEWIDEEDDNSEWRAIKHVMLVGFALARERSLENLEELLEQEHYSLGQLIELHTILNYLHSFKEFNESVIQKLLIKIPKVNGWASQGFSFSGIKSEDWEVNTVMTSNSELQQQYNIKKSEFGRQLAILKTRLSQLKNNQETYLNLNRLLFNYFFKYASNYDAAMEVDIQELIKRPLFLSLFDFIISSTFENLEKREDIFPEDLEVFFEEDQPLKSLLGSVFTPAYFEFLSAVDRVDPFLNKIQASFELLDVVYSTILTNSTKPLDEMSLGLEFLVEHNILERVEKMTNSGNLSLILLLSTCLQSFF